MPLPWLAHARADARYSADERHERQTLRGSLGRADGEGGCPLPDLRELPGTGMSPPQRFVPASRLRCRAACWQGASSSEPVSSGPRRGARVGEGGRRSARRPEARNSLSKDGAGGNAIRLGSPCAPSPYGRCTGIVRDCGDAVSEWQKIGSRQSIACSRRLRRNPCPKCRGRRLRVGRGICG